MTDRKTKTINYKQDSVPKCLKSRAIIPCTGTVVKSCRNGIKQLSSSNELDAQYVSPHQRTKRKEYHTWKSCACLIIGREIMQYDAAKVAAKTEVSGNSERLHSWRNASARNPWDRKISGTDSKGWKNSMAGCCSLLRWITNLKFVNSVVRTVITHPEKGCLNWLHGTMSEPPWKSH